MTIRCPRPVSYTHLDVYKRQPHWKADSCIQCNQCSYVCPHGCIRPVLVTDEEIKKAPAGFETRPAKGAEGLKFRMAISPNDLSLIHI